ncbi:MAG: (2Fe-2S)-binding protein [Blastocatellia bacterium]|nr:(2Fe-2S)-binding protein [Blastocatellia bacterium]
MLLHQAAVCQNWEVAIYPAEIMERLTEPKNNADLRDANASGTGVSFLCGSRVTIKLRIDPDSNIVTAGGFTTNGCGYMAAAADTRLDEIAGKPVAELGSLRAGENYPERRRQCSEVVAEALRKALADNRQRIVEEYTGEKALICTCFGVGEDTIESVIRKQGANSVDAVSEMCRAGLGCGSCRMLIQEMLDDAEATSGAV